MITDWWEASAAELFRLPGVTIEFSVFVSVKGQNRNALAVSSIRINQGPSHYKKLSFVILSFT